LGSVIWVALGGAVGAVGRYGISLLPWKGAFPLLTLATNFLGAVAIGFLSGLFSQRLLGERGKLFWQTGVCGSFTTFSTFSRMPLQVSKATTSAPSSSTALMIFSRTPALGQPVTSRRGRPAGSLSLPRRTARRQRWRRPSTRKWRGSTLRRMRLTSTTGCAG